MTRLARLTAFHSPWKFPLTSAMALVLSITMALPGLAADNKVEAVTLEIAPSDAVLSGPPPVPANSVDCVSSQGAGAASAALGITNTTLITQGACLPGGPGLPGNMVGFSLPVVSCQTGAVKNTSIGFFIPNPPGPPGRYHLYLWRDQGGLPNDACGLECAVAPGNPQTIPVAGVSTQTFDWFPLGCPCHTTAGERIHIGAVFAEITPAPADWNVTRDTTQPSAPGRAYINLSGNHGGWNDLHGFGPPGPYAHPYLVQNVISTDCGTTNNCVYPPAGPDTFDSWATVIIDLPALGITGMNVMVMGPTTINRGDPILLGDGRYRIETEMVQLDLHGISCLGPLVVRESPSRPSMGRVEQTDASICYPASSIFDVFLEVSVNGMVLHNEDPIRMDAVNGINSLPPYDDEYQSPFDIVIYDQNGQPVGRILDVSHIPHPPRDCFFSNADIQTSFGPLQGSGMTDVLRDAPLWNGVEWETRIEMLSMDLRGNSPQGPFRLRESPSRPSMGSIRSPGFDTFPAQSFFDVFVEIELQTQTLCNQQPFHMVATIQGVPPTMDPFQSQGPPITMVDCQSGQPVLQVFSVVHIPKEPFDWTPPPPPGRDCFCSTARVLLLMPNGSQVPIDNLYGPTDIQRFTPVQLPDGRYQIQTEMLALNLQSLNTPIGPVSIHLNPAIPSQGSMIQMQPGPLFPMDSFFDVFVVVETQQGPLHNQQPIMMQAQINSIPPDEPYQGFGDIMLFDANGNPTGIRIIQEIHDPGDPFDWGPQCPVVLECPNPDTGGMEEPADAPPAIQAVRLYPGLPNPFSASTTIAFDLKTGGQTLLRVYDIAGRLVQTLVESELPAQTHQEVTWNGTDQNGREVGAGIYFVRLEAEGLNLTRKVILLK